MRQIAHTNCTIMNSCEVHLRNRAKVKRFQLFSGEYLYSLKVWPVATHRRCLRVKQSSSTCGNVGNPYRIISRPSIRIFTLSRINIRNEDEDSYDPGA